MKLLNVILYTAAAVIWSINAALHFIYDTSLPLQLLNTLCALIWWIGLLVQLWRWKKN